MESKYLRYDMDKWKDVNASNYESKAFWDKKWIEVGIDLLESSRLLKQKINEVWESRIQLNKDPSTVLITDHYHGVYLMLIAYAVENLFKAVIVKNNSARFRQQFKRDKKFPAILKSHELMGLAEKAEFSTTLKEEELLRRLTRSSIWFGRYPVPLNYRELSGIRRFSNGKNYSVSWLGSKDIIRLDALLEKIKQFLRINRD